MNASPRLEAVFYRTGNDNEPVREWLKALSKEDRRAIGEDIAYVQFKSNEEIVMAEKRFKDCRHGTTQEK